MIPDCRKIRVFSFDPSYATRLETHMINEITLKVRWECDPQTGISSLQPGPVGEYIEVVDYDPASQCFYAPVDLDSQKWLAQEGVPPSVGKPEFHQQMVYAVAMTTIDHFEKALGRTMLWSSHLNRDEHGVVNSDKDDREKFVRRLRIYPHALRDSNAYYSPSKKALLFGYFPAAGSDPQNIVPGSLVFTCLSHDIIVHETTHALLDGLHPRFIEPCSADTLAFHEAFADIVALFQHFSYPSILKHQISATRGDLENPNHLAQLAQQFGLATGCRGSLRSAIGTVDRKTGKWTRATPDPDQLKFLTKPHNRGAILVAAIFDVFLAIYKSRVNDLIRIATSGKGEEFLGHPPTELVDRLADEAEKTARHLLHMCIRALDYCPPVAITFGDYLRALITADYEINPADPWRFRVAIMESFRQHGIRPAGIKTYSEASLLWPRVEFPENGAQPAPPRPMRQTVQQEKIIGSLRMPRFKVVQMAQLEPDEPESARMETREPTAMDESAAPGAPEIPTLAVNWDLNVDRYAAWKSMKRNAKKLNKIWIPQLPPDWTEENLCLILRKTGIPSVWANEKTGIPSTEVHAVRIARRLGPRGEFVTELVVEITQRRRGYLDLRKQALVDSGAISNQQLNDDPKYRPDFRFRGGCTLLLDPVTGALRYVISKRSVLDDEKLNEQRQYLEPGQDDLGVTYSGSRTRFDTNEKFAFLHR